MHDSMIDTIVQLFGAQKEIIHMWILSFHLRFYQIIFFLVSLVLFILVDEFL